MAGVVVLDSPEILATETFERLAVFDLGDDAVDAELFEGHGTIPAEKLVRDPRRLFSLAVGSNDGVGSGGPATDANGRGGASDEPTETHAGLFELRSDFVVGGRIPR